MLVTNQSVEFKEEHIQVQDFGINLQTSIEKPKDHNM